MLIASSMPAVTDIALSGGTWLTTDTWTALVDGRPSRAARIQRSGPVTLTITLKSAIVPGVVAVLGLNVPANTTITAAEVNTSTHTLPGAPRCAWLQPTGTASITSLTLTIAGSGLLQIGEIAIMPAWDVPIEPDWNVELVDPTESTRDRGSQLVTASRVPYRRLQARLQAQGMTTMHRWESLRMNLTRGHRAIAIPRHGDPTSLHRTAIYGIGHIGPIAHLGGNWFSAPLTLDELPAAT